MEYLVGLCLALAVGAFGTVFGFDRQRSFYSTVLIVVASYYGLFAVMSGSGRVLLAESAVIAIFVVLSVLGFRFSLWLVAAALVAHGVFDFFHHDLISNPGVPAWWPMFCMTYDCTAGVYLAWLLRRSRKKARDGDQFDPSLNVRKQAYAND